MPRFVVFDDKSRFLDRFGLLLVVTIASIVVLMLIDIGPRVTQAAGRWESVLATVLVGTTLLLSLRASGLRLRFQRVADVVVLGVVLGVVALALLVTMSSHTPPPTRVAPVLVVLLAILAPLSVVRRISQHRQVTRGTLLGAISGYLLLPIAFFYMFLTLAAWSDTPFFGEPRPTTTFMYFSLTTITTTGYGDFTATSQPARLLAMSEALLGQIYLVTFVALLVGLFAASWLDRRAQR